MNYGPSIDIDEIAGLAVTVDQGNVKDMEVEYNSQPVAPESTRITDKKCKTPEDLFNAGTVLIRGMEHGGARHAKDTVSILSIFNNVVSATCVEPLAIVSLKMVT